MKSNVLNPIPLIKSCFFALMGVLLIFTGCRKDVAEACRGISSVTDVDGNVYYTVQIGTQCWIQSNLKASRYRNGDTIVNAKGHSNWYSARIGAWCNYNDDATKDSLFGKLYNWYAVSDSRGLCPTGWHVPSEAEWTTLIDYLGGEAEAGDKMKGIAGWESPNMGDLNSSGFTGLPGGRRYSRLYRYPTYIAGSAGLGAVGIWWSSTMVESTKVFFRLLNANSPVATAGIYDRDQEAVGFSCRCIQD